VLEDVSIEHDYSRVFPSLVSTTPGLMDMKRMPWEEYIALYLAMSMLSAALLMEYAGDIERERVLVVSLGRSQHGEHKRLKELRRTNLDLPIQ
jgi:hypothetical protein